MTKAKKKRGEGKLPSGAQKNEFPIPRTERGAGLQPGLQHLLRGDLCDGPARLLAPLSPSGTVLCPWLSATSPAPQLPAGQGSSAL